jgi:hypothetical protein
MENETNSKQRDLLLDMIPVTELYCQKILSKPSLYKYVREGLFGIYKLGGRSYVRRAEFNAAFRKAEIAQK